MEVGFGRWVGRLSAFAFLVACADLGSGVPNPFPLGAAVVDDSERRPKQIPYPDLPPENRSTKMIRHFLTGLSIVI